LHTDGYSKVKLDEKFQFDTEIKQLIKKRGAQPNTDRSHLNANPDQRSKFDIVASLTQLREDKEPYPSK